MGNTSSDRAVGGHGGEKTHRRDSRGAKDGDRPKILMDSPEDADIFHGEDIKVSGPIENRIPEQHDLCCVAILSVEGLHLFCITLRSS